MFYCNDCKDKNKWPEGLSKSFGTCEICGNIALCNDVSSSRLPEQTDNDNEDKAYLVELRFNYTISAKNKEEARKKALQLIRETPESDYEIFIEEL